MQQLLSTPARRKWRPVMQRTRRIALWMFTAGLLLLLTQQVTDRHRYAASEEQMDLVRGKRDIVAQMGWREAERTSDIKKSDVSSDGGSQGGDASDKKDAAPKAEPEIKIVEKIVYKEVPAPGGNDDDPFLVRESGPKLDPNLAQCDLKYKWKECKVDFKIAGSKTQWRKGSVFVQGKEALPFVTNGIHIIVLDQNCEVTETVNFRLIDRAAEYYDSLPRGTVIAGITTGILGTIVQRKFGMVFEKEPTPFRDYMFPFVVKKEYDGLGNHLVVPLQGDDVNWGHSLYLGHYRGVTKENVTYSDMLKKYQHLYPGGRYTPTECKAINKVAIIVPYRKREDHLRKFLNNMIGFLSDQKVIDFTIYIVEQAEPEIFNRASLMNIGYIEAKKIGNYDCYAFHDVDLLPEDLANTYSCTPMPRHLVVGRDKHKYRLRYPEFFGGAIMMTHQAIDKINGFCNILYGWGGEDDNIYLRVRTAGLLPVARFPASIATYIMLEHERDAGNPRSGRKSPFGLKNTGTKKAKKEGDKPEDPDAKPADALGYEDIWQESMQSHKDGLSTVNYTLLTTEKRRMYTHVFVRIPGPTLEDVIPATPSPEHPFAAPEPANKLIWQGPGAGKPGKS